jgi:hypothetical protein
MRELARRIGISEAELAYGKDPLDSDVAQAVRAVEAAAAAGDPDDVAKAYQALSRAASKAASQAARAVAVV